jgi:hypothetical protein
MHWNEIPNDQCHWGDPLGAFEMISEPMVRSVQIVHLSCVKISTVTKQTKMSIHLSLVSLGYNRVHPKRILSLWYILAQTMDLSRLALSPNRPKGASTWDSPPRCTIRCVQNDFWAYGTYLALTLPLSPNGLKWDSTWPKSHRRTIERIQNDFLAYGTFDANSAPISHQD